MEETRYTLDDFKFLLWQRDLALIQLQRQIVALSQEVAALRAELSKQEQPMS